MTFTHAHDWVYTHEDGRMVKWCALCGHHGGYA